MLNALDTYELRELESTTFSEEASPWTIDSLESADWALRKIAVLKKKNDEIHQLAEKERERISEWEDKETHSNQESIAFFESKLADYLHELRKNDPKAKIKTPHGTVSTRKQPDSWEYQGDTLNTLKELGLTEFITIKESINKAELKKAVQVLENGRVISPDGEVIESIKVIPQGEKVIVKEV
ncbi:hypothetical protein IGJ28_000729 [Enterococcus sp. AZ091]|uniref:host-nuclease inhibitor Gam family protein n=1 Tax=Enterococcus sp. AZ091 TaxID=2774720 RepID=UPI003F24E215